MPLTAIDRALDAITDGSLGRPLQRLVDAAAYIARTPAAILTVRRGPVDVILAARGIPLVAYRPWLPAMPGTDAILGRPRLIPDVSRDPLFARHPLAGNGSGWQWAVLVPVPLPGLSPCVMLTCGDPRAGTPRPHDLLERLQLLAQVVADEVELIDEIAMLTHAAQREAVAAVAPGTPAAELPLNVPESPAVVTEFLLSTLVPQRRLLRRGAVPYHALAKWRASLKAWQIAALRALKREPPPALVERVAADFADAAHSLYGTGTFKAVVGVPCGHSGPGCLAAKLAEATARRLEVPHVDAFAPIAVKGSSHPRRNARRPAMALRQACDMPVLLIDDVASSGAHVEEAAKLVRATAPAVLPLVWIAD